MLAAESCATQDVAALAQTSFDAFLLDPLLLGWMTARALAPATSSNPGARGSA